MWNFETGELLSSAEEHTGIIRDLAYSPTGDRLVSGSEIMTVVIWNTADPTDLSVRSRLLGHTNHVHAVAFSADGTNAASGANDNLVSVWSVPLATPAPTALPTLSPGPTSLAQTVTCANDPDFRAGGEKKRNCACVLVKKQRRINQCKKQKTTRNYPILCGVCCGDSGTFRFRIPSGKRRGCVWLRRGNRAEGFCKKNKVRTECVESCDNCVI